MYVTVFYQPVYNLLVFLYNIIPAHDFGFAIIALTIIIKLILYPLSQHTIKSQKALQELQPKIEALKIKFKDNKEELAKATMAIYRDHKINPFSSCLPLLIQLPFLFAVFRVFSNFSSGADMKLLYSFVARPEFSSGLRFLNFVDLAKPNYYLAILAGLAQFWQTKMLMTKKPAIQTPGSQDENMASIMNKQMTYMMPILTVVIGVSLPGGLTLYWFIFSLLSALQQLFIFKQKDKPSLLDGEIIK
jgi:YidC/Oxa1 family membrane protein insertase